MPVQLSGLIITLNEEKHIKACIESLLPVVDEIVVVDSLSTDKTKEICLQYPIVKFVEQKFLGHIEQKNYAVSQATYDYVLSLDADERVSDEMASSILAVKNKWLNDGYSFNRLNNYCGTWLKRSWYPDTKIRLWDRRKGQWGGTNPHDKVMLLDGQKPELLKGDLIHYAYSTVEEHATQIDKFATIAATAKYKKGKKANRVIHLLLNPTFKFVRKYLVKGGFLDGYYGLIYSYMAARLNYLKYKRLLALNKGN